MSGRAKKRRRAKIRIPQPRQIFGGIKPRLPKRTELGAEWLLLTGLPGFTPEVQHGHIHFCVDHDVNSEVVRDLRENLGMNLECARDNGLDGKDDDAIMAWVRKRGRVLLTSNHHDFCNEQKHKTHESPGVIAIGLPNDGAHVPETLWMLDLLFVQLANHVPRDWWARTKIRIYASHFELTMHRNGRISRYELRPDSRGRLKVRGR